MLQMYMAYTDTKSADKGSISTAALYLVGYVTGIVIVLQMEPMSNKIATLLTEMRRFEECYTCK